MRSLFVTATGTGIGKTYAVAALLDACRKKNLPVTAIKPVITGFDLGLAEGTDAAILLSAMGRTRSISELDLVSPFRFVAPLSPDMAARRENRSLRHSDVVRFCLERLGSPLQSVIVEGVGGVMSPISEDATVIETMVALELPVLLISGSYLGAISHALTAVNTLHSRRLKLSAILVNESVEREVGLDETCATLRRFIPVEQAPLILSLQRNPPKPEYDRCFGTIVDTMISRDDPKVSEAGSH